MSSLGKYLDTLELEDRVKNFILEKEQLRELFSEIEEAVREEATDQRGSMVPAPRSIPHYFELQSRLEITHGQVEERRNLRDALAALYFAGGHSLIRRFEYLTSEQRDPKEEDAHQRVIDQGAHLLLRAKHFFHSARTLSLSGGYKLPNEIAAVNFRVGKIFLDLIEPVIAEEYLRSAYELEPDNPDYAGAYGELIGAPFQKIDERAEGEAQQEREEAIGTLRVLLDKNLDHGNLAEGVLKLYKRLERWEDIITLYEALDIVTETIVEITLEAAEHLDRPDYRKRVLENHKLEEPIPDIHTELGVCYLHDGDVETGIALLFRGIRSSTETFDRHEKAEAAYTTVESDGTEEQKVQARYMVARAAIEARAPERALKVLAELPDLTGATACLYQARLDARIAAGERNGVLREYKELAREVERVTDREDLIDNTYRKFHEGIALTRINNVDAAKTNFTNIMNTLERNPEDQRVLSQWHLLIRATQALVNLGETRYRARLKQYREAAIDRGFEIPLMNESFNESR